MEAVSTIRVSLLLTRLLRKTYQGLNNLLEKIAEKDISDEEKKQKLTEWITNSRKQWLRFLVLLKWVKKGAADSNLSAKQLAQQKANDIILVRVADQFYKNNDDLNLVARAPVYDVHTAVDVFTSGTYFRLPAIIDPVSEHAITEKLSIEKEQEIKNRIHDLIQYRLFSETIPKQFTKITIKNGRAYCVVENEFQVEFTLLKEDLPFLILDAKILVKSINESSLISQKVFMGITQLLQYHIIRKGKPLQVIYNVLHDLCISIAFEILRDQIEKIPKESTRFKLLLNLLPNKTTDELAICYWLRPGYESNELKFDITQLQDRRVNFVRIQKNSISPNNLNDEKPASLIIQHYPADAYCSPCSVPAINFSKISVEKILLQILSFHCLRKLNNLYRLIVKSNQFKINTRSENGIIAQLSTVNQPQKLGGKKSNEVTTQLINHNHIPNPNQKAIILNNSNSAIHKVPDTIFNQKQHRSVNEIEFIESKTDDEVIKSNIRIPLYGSRILSISVDIYTGDFLLRLNVDDQRLSLYLHEAQESLNIQLKNNENKNSEIFNVLSRLYYESIMIYIEQYMSYLELDRFHSSHLFKYSNNISFRFPIESNDEHTNKFLFFRLRIVETSCYFLAINVNNKLKLNILLFHASIEKVTNIMTIDLITTLIYDKFISDFNLSFCSQLVASNKANLQDFIENRKPLQENLQNLPENIQIPMKNDQLKDVLDSVSNYCNNKLISQISFIQILNKEKIQFKLNKSDEIEFNLPNCEPLIIKRFLLSFNEQQNQWEVIIQEEKSILKDIEITNDENNSQVSYHKDQLLWKIQNKNLSFNELEVILRILKGICRTVELAIKWKKIKEQASTDPECQFLVSKFSLFKFKLFTVVFEYTLDDNDLKNAHNIDLTGDELPIEHIQGNKYYLTIQCSLNYSIICSSEQSLFKRAIDSNINLTRDLKSILQMIWRTTKPLQIIQSQFSVSSQVLPTDFIFIPHSATRLRVVYRSKLALDIRFIYDDRISLDDGSSSLFSADRSEQSIKPIHGLDEILGDGPKLIAHDNLELSLRSIHNLMGSLSLQYDILKFIQDNYKTTVPEIVTEKKKALSFKVRLPAIGNAPPPVVTFQITNQNYEYLEMNSTLSDAPILNEFLKHITRAPFRSENIKIFLSILFTAPIQNFIPLFKAHTSNGNETKVTLCLNSEKSYVVDKQQSVARFTLRCICRSTVIDFPITYNYSKDIVRKLNGDNNSLGRIVTWLESLTLDALIDARKTYKEDEPRKF